MVRSSLGEFEQAVLVTLVRLHGNAYGVPIHRKLSERGKEVAIGAVYTTLDRLEEKGFVRSRRGDPTPERGGRAKRYFEITAAGQRALEETHAARKRMWDGFRPSKVPA
jgi:PadR family transcriptional regulator, regulatory protein PadR